MDRLIRQRISDAVEIEEIRAVLQKQVRSERGAQVMKRSLFLITAIGISMIWSEALADVNSRQATEGALPGLSKISELARYSNMSPEEKVDWQISEIERAMANDGQAPLDSVTRQELRRILLENRLRPRE